MKYAAIWFKNNQTGTFFLKLYKMCLQSF